MQVVFKQVASKGGATTLDKVSQVVSTKIDLEYLRQHVGPGMFDAQECITIIIVHTCSVRAGDPRNQLDALCQVSPYCAAQRGSLMNDFAQEIWF